MPRTVFSLYLESGMRGCAWLPSSFGDPAERAARTRAAAKRRCLAPGPIADDLDGAAAVVTGQQVGLLLGPLYTLHKAATAVATARLLERESGVRCVPVFWLQTEDHDFAEIARCRVGDSEYGLTVDDARVSVGTRRLGPEIEPLVASVCASLEGLPHAPEVAALLNEHYRPGAPLARAFGGLLTALFADHGLRVFDPRDPQVARLAAPLYRRALTDRDAIDALLSARLAALRAEGFTEQVKLRPGSPLCFVHSDGAEGPRARLAPGFDEPALLERLEREPQAFSTSALLRPLVEDTLLPTAAYVGGPAEVEYFAELAPLYAHFGIEPPLVVPRARFRLIPPPARRLLDALGLPPADVEQPRDQLLERFIRKPDDAPSSHWISELGRRLDALAAAEPSLERAIRRTRDTARRALSRLQTGHHRALVERERVTTERVARLQAWLFPGGAPQERVHAFPWYAAYAGPRALVDALVAAADPLHPTIRDLPL
jgi:bacillithiol biosynthesis cysteine-adding enzyme BshC